MRFRNKPALKTLSGFGMTCQQRMKPHYLSLRSASGGEAIPFTFLLITHRLSSIAYRPLPIACIIAHSAD
ncbi:MAG TPA: hypothetical protein ACFYD6_13065 [Candidatus Brocadiia bacterium]|nr:hypothetical protein [Candidatus Brocadiales bacterium]